MSAPSVPPSEADVVAADLPSVQLADGSHLALEAGMANVLLVERRYGSVGGLITAFNAFAAKDGETAEDAANRPVFGPVVDILACFMPRGPLRNPEELAERLPARLVGEYVTALGEVIRLAFPQAPVQTDGQTSVAGPGNGLLPPLPASAYPAGSVPLSPTGTGLSPGPPSSTAPPSSSGEPTPSSGG